MKRVSFQLKVRQDRIAEYRDAHRKVWPDMLEALRRHGHRNYSIFIDGTGYLYFYLEMPDDPEKAFSDMAAEEVSARWRDHMRPLFEDTQRTPMVEVFHLAAPGDRPPQHGRVGFLLKVRRERIDGYREHHRKVWPDMLSALQKHGWHNYSLFMRSDGLLFGYVEVAQPFEQALAGMAGEEVNARWQALMAPYFENLGGGRPDQNMRQLTEAFHLD
jgi:L-rhamnose mutarotase